MQVEMEAVRIQLAKRRPSARKFLPRKIRHQRNTLDLDSAIFSIATMAGNDYCPKGIKINRASLQRQ